MINLQIILKSKHALESIFTNCNRRKQERDLNPLNIWPRSPEATRPISPKKSSKSKSKRKKKSSYESGSDTTLRKIYKKKSKKSKRAYEDSDGVSESDKRDRKEKRAGVDNVDTSRQLLNQEDWQEKPLPGIFL